jgi:hypothetical protein
MSGKKIRKTQRMTQAALILLLSFGGSVMLAHSAMAVESSAAAASPSSAQIQSWKDYLKNYPAALAEYQREQTEGRQTAQPVSVSDEKSMDDLVKTYPFLKDDIQQTKDIEQTIKDNIKKNPPPAGPASLIAKDTTTHMQATEVQDKDLGIKFLFVSKTGRLWCGTHGCNMEVYLDTGAGYQPATGFITTGMYIAKIGTQVVLFAGPPQIPDVVEWILKDNKFVKNTAPPPEPQSPAFTAWKQKLQKDGKWPPQ